MLEKDIEKVLITKEEIQVRCEELGLSLIHIYNFLKH